MVSVIQGGNVADAWQRGCELIIQTPDHIVRNLITEVENPTYTNRDWFTRFDPKSGGADDRLSVVAKVLFPETSMRSGENRLAYYQRWATILERARRSGRLHSSWGGTYFQRLLSIGGSDNQIENAIRVLRGWRNRSETAIVAHLSNPAIDGLRPRGSPCLQFIEILWRPNAILDLVAVYRNHDYLNKTLWNFIGLGRLLSFIAMESGKRPGRLVCHSVRAYTDSVGKLRRLIVR
jgi:thymidylate synthase